MPTRANLTLGNDGVSRKNRCAVGAQICDLLFMGIFVSSKNRYAVGTQICDLLLMGILAGLCPCTNLTLDADLVSFRAFL